MKWFIPVLAPLIFISCSGQNTDSRFGEILSEAPYASISDSIQKFPQKDELYFRRAILLNKNNLPEPALEDFRKAWSLKKNEEYAIAVARTLRDKNTDSEVLFLNEATSQLPQSIFLHIMLAKAYDSQNKTDDAIRVCDQILQLDSVQPNTLVLKADLLQKKNDVNGVIEQLEKVNRVVPDNIELANRLAYQYAETKNPKTVAFCDMMIKNDSMKFHAEPYYVKGVYYTNIGDKAKAIQLFDETIRHDHRMLNAYIEKGKIQLDQKKLPDALKTFTLANTVSPAFPDAWYWIGHCQEKMGQKDEAKLSYQKAYSLDKTFTEAKEAADKLK